MKQRLTERYVIDLMKEEWNKKLDSLLEKLGHKQKSEKKKPDDGLSPFVTINGKREDVLSGAEQLKVKKKATKGDPNSEIEYTLIDVNQKNKTVTLRRPDKNGSTKDIVITLDQFVNDYVRG